MSGTGYLLNPNSNTEIVSIIVPILQGRKLRQRHAAVPVHKAGKWRSQNFNLGSLVLDPVPLISVLLFTPAYTL